MLIALTGTPGVGKSTAAKILKDRGYNVQSVNELAKRFNCIEDGIVDVDRLSRFVEGEMIVEGHLSHLLNPEVAIVLRCNPLKLKERLKSKGWDEEKVLENVEAEIVDVILIESLEYAKEVYEIDTTNLSPEEVANAVEEILKGKGGKYKPGKIDWISEVGEFIEDLMRKDL